MRWNRALVIALVVVALRPGVSFSLEPKAGEARLRQSRVLLGLDGDTGLAHPKETVDGPRLLTILRPENDGTPAALGLADLQVALDVLEADAIDGEVMEHSLQPLLQSAALSPAAGLVKAERDRAVVLATRGLWQIEIRRASANSRASALSTALRSRHDGYYLPYAAMDVLVRQGGGEAESMLAAVVDENEAPRGDAKLRERALWALEAVRVRRAAARAPVGEEALSTVMTALDQSLSSRSQEASDFRLWLVRTLAELGASRALQAIAADSRYDGDIRGAAAFLAGHRTIDLP